MDYDLDFSKNYLMTGGLAEVIGLTDINRQYGQEKVTISTDLAMALCLFADEAIKARKEGAA